MTDKTFQGFYAIVIFLLTTAVIYNIAGGKATQNFLWLVLIGVLISHAKQIQSITL